MLLIRAQKSGIIKNDIIFSLLVVKKWGTCFSYHSFTCPVLLNISWSGGDVRPASSDSPQGERAEVSGVESDGPEGPGSGWSFRSRKSQRGAGGLQGRTTGRADSLGRDFLLFKQYKVKVNRTGGSRAPVYCGRPDSDLGAPHGKSHSYQSRIPAG